MQVCVHLVQKCLHQLVVVEGPEVQKCLYQLVVVEDPEVPTIFGFPFAAVWAGVHS